jgi:hypothetical protein
MNSRNFREVIAMSNAEHVDDVVQRTHLRRSEVEENIAGLIETAKRFGLTLIHAQACELTRLYITPAMFEGVLRITGK